MGEFASVLATKCIAGENSRALARGLISVRPETRAAPHPAPSDIATLGQPLPVGFLRGVGLFDAAIEARSCLTEYKDQFRSCFVSYSVKDTAFAEKLHEDLQQHGVRCWFAPHSLPIGAKTLNAIDQQISKLESLLIILSANSLKSGWVEDEVNKAYAEERRRKKLVLVPIRLDDTVMRTKEAWAAKLRDQRNIGNFSMWRRSSNYHRALRQLLTALAVPKQSKSVLVRNSRPA
jgi:hypothetical protein